MGTAQYVTLNSRACGPYLLGLLTRAVVRTVNGWLLVRSFWTEVSIEWTECALALIQKLPCVWKS